MELTPRYDGPPILRFDGPTADVARPLIRQRRRLGEMLDGLTVEQWSTTSRCSDWTVRDVAAHLVGTDQFWLISATQAIEGKPTRYLANFDPAVTPGQLVDATREQSSDEVMAAYRAGVDGLEQALEQLSEAQWLLPAEAPPGHVPLAGLAHHALWDGWIHERDIALPLGLTSTEEPDELLACLRYAAALGPMLLASRGSTRKGTLVLEGTVPTTRVVIEAGETVVIGNDSKSPDAAHLSGETVALIESLSQRAQLSIPLNEADEWLIEGLAQAFAP